MASRRTVAGPGFTVQRGQVVAMATITPDSPDPTLLRPDHDVIVHISPSTQGPAVTLLANPDKTGDTTIEATGGGSAGTASTGAVGEGNRAASLGGRVSVRIEGPSRRKLTRERVSMVPGSGRGNSARAGVVLRRWEHMDDAGTLSRGLVRQDGSFSFTNCRPSEICRATQG